MSYTKPDLLQDLADMGLTGQETILIHSSMKSIGPVDGGADTVLDAEYLLQVQGVFYIFVLANAVTQAGHPQVVPESFSDYIAVDYRS